MTDYDNMKLLVSGRGFGKTVRSHNNLRNQIKQFRKDHPEEAKSYVIYINPNTSISQNLLQYLKSRSIEIIKTLKIEGMTILYQKKDSGIFNTKFQMGVDFGKTPSTTGVFHPKGEVPKVLHRAYVINQIWDVLTKELKIEPTNGMEKGYIDDMIKDVKIYISINPVVCKVGIADHNDWGKDVPFKDLDVEDPVHQGILKWFGVDFEWLNG